MLENPLEELKKQKFDINNTFISVDPGGYEHYFAIFRNKNLIYYNKFNTHNFKVLKDIIDKYKPSYFFIEDIFLNPKYINAIKMFQEQMRLRVWLEDIFNIPYILINNKTWMKEFIHKDIKDKTERYKILYNTVINKYKINIKQSNKQDNIIAAISIGTFIINYFNK